MQNHIFTGIISSKNNRKMQIKDRTRATEEENRK